MKELLDKIKSGSLTDDLLTKISSAKKDKEFLENLHKEYFKKDRTIRDTQIGFTQKDKTVKDEKGRDRTVKAIRIPISFNKKIVRTSVAFEFGNPVVLKPSEVNELTEAVEDVWKECRLDSKLQKIKEYQRSETQSALVFQVKKIAGTENKIKCKVLNYKSGSFWPVFDEFGDMVLFVWSFKTKINGKDVENLWAFDETIIYKYKKTNSWVLESRDSHSFSKIPVIYFSQSQPEYDDVKELIDRYETSVSKLGASNNYSGSPLLFTKGEVQGMPDRDSDGKMLNAPLGYDEDDKPMYGDAKFLTHDNAPKSVELEQKTLENLIYSLSDTPNLSFNNLKGIGNVSGVALELMFLGSILKAKMNEGDNRTDIQRIINVIISGITTKVNMSLKKASEGLHYDVQFSSILPSDLAGLVTTLTTAVTGNIMSRETAIDLLGKANTDEEMKKIEAEKKPDEGE